MGTRLIIKNPNTVVCSELDLLTKLLRRYYDLSLGLVLLICLRMEEDGICVLSLSLVLSSPSVSSSSPSSTAFPDRGIGYTSSVRYGSPFLMTYWFLGTILTVRSTLTK